MIERSGNDVMQKLACERFKRELTLKSVAEFIGVDTKTLSLYERLRVNAPFWVVESFCKKLEFKIVIFDKRGKKIYESV